MPKTFFYLQTVPVLAPQEAAAATPTIDWMQQPVVPVRTRRQPFQNQWIPGYVADNPSNSPAGIEWFVLPTNPVPRRRKTLIVDPLPPLATTTSAAAVIGQCTHAYNWNVTYGYADDWTITYGYADPWTLCPE